MSKKLTSWECDPTTVITVDNRPVAVQTLPEDIKFEISTYDKIRADYLELLYEKEKLHLAMTTKYAQIVRAVTETFKPAANTAPGDTNDT